MTKKFRGILFLLLLAFFGLSCQRQEGEKFALYFMPKETQAKTLLGKSPGEEAYCFYAYKGHLDVMIGKEKLPFKKALKEGKIRVEDILIQAKKDFQGKDLGEYTYADGGSILYPYSQYTLIKFNEIEGRKDLYICPRDTKIDQIE